MRPSALADGSQAKDEAHSNANTSDQPEDVRVILLRFMREKKSLASRIDQLQSDVQALSKDRDRAREDLQVARRELSILKRLQTSSGDLGELDTDSHSTANAEPHSSRRDSKHAGAHRASGAVPLEENRRGHSQEFHSNAASPPYPDADMYEQAMEDLEERHEEEEEEEEEAVESERVAELQQELDMVRDQADSIINQKQQQVVSLRRRITEIAAGHEQLSGSAVQNTAAELTEALRKAAAAAGAQTQSAVEGLAVRLGDTGTTAKGLVQVATALIQIAEDMGSANAVAKHDAPWSNAHGATDGNAKDEQVEAQRQELEQLQSQLSQTEQRMRDYQAEAKALQTQRMEFETLAQDLYEDNEQLRTTIQTVTQQFKHKAAECEQLVDACHELKGTIDRQYHTIIMGETNIEVLQRDLDMISRRYSGLLMAQQAQSPAEVKQSFEEFQESLNTYERRFARLTETNVDLQHKLDVRTRELHRAQGLVQELRSALQTSQQEREGAEEALAEAGVNLRSARDEMSQLTSQLANAQADEQMKMEVELLRDGLRDAEDKNIQLQNECQLLRQHMAAAATDGTGPDESGEDTTDSEYMRRHTLGHTDPRELLHAPHLRFTVDLGGHRRRSPEEALSASSDSEGDPSVVQSAVQAQHDQGNAGAADGDGDDDDDDGFPRDESHDEQEGDEEEGSRKTLQYYRRLRQEQLRLQREQGQGRWHAHAQRQDASSESDDHERGDYGGEDRDSALHEIADLRRELRVLRRSYDEMKLEKRELEGRLGSVKEELATWEGSNNALTVELKRRGARAQISGNDAQQQRLPQRLQQDEAEDEPSKETARMTILTEPLPEQPLSLPEQQQQQQQQRQQERVKAKTASPLLQMEGPTPGLKRQHDSCVARMDALMKAKRELKTVTSERQALVTLRLAMDQQLQHLQEALEGTLESEERLHQENASLHRVAEEHKELREQLQTQAEQATAKRVEAEEAQARAEQQLEGLRARVERLLHEKNAMEQERAAAVEEVTGAKEALATAQEELTSAKEELTTAQEELTSTKEELTTAQEELTSAKEELTSAKEQHRAELDDLQGELREATETVGRQQGVEERLEMEQEQKEELQNQLAALQRQQEEQLSDLRAQVSVLESDRKNLSRDNDSLQSTLEQQRREHESLVTLYEESREKIAQLEQAKSSQPAYRDTLARDLLDAKTRLSTVEGQLNQAQVERDELRHKLQATEATLSRVRGELQQAEEAHEQEVDSMTRDSDARLAALRKDLDSEIQVLSRTNRDLRQRLAQAEQNVEARDQTIAELQVTVEKMQAELTAVRESRISPALHDVSTTSTAAWERLNESIDPILEDLAEPAATHNEHFVSAMGKLQVLLQRLSKHGPDSGTSEIIQDITSSVASSQPSEPSEQQQQQKQQRQQQQQKQQQQKQQQQKQQGSEEEDDEFRRALHSLEELKRSFSATAFAQQVFRPPRLAKPAVPNAPLSPARSSSTATTGTGGVEGEQREQWVRKVHDLTLQLQESSMFWVNKVRSLNSSIDANKKLVVETFSKHAKRTKLLIHTLMQAFVTALQHLYTVHFRGFAQPTLMVDIADYIHRIQEQLTLADSRSPRHRHRR